MRFSGEANDSAIKNFAVKQTNDPWILFLDERIEPIEPDWLTVMAEHVQRPEVGAVSGRLLNPNATIEQAGMIVGVKKIAQRGFSRFSGRTSWGESPIAGDTKLQRRFERVYARAA